MKRRTRGWGLIIYPLRNALAPYKEGVKERGCDGADDEVKSKTRI